MIQATCKAAIDAGDKYFFTGKPCIRKHIAKRRVGDRVCVECQKERCNSPKFKVKKLAYIKSEQGKATTRIRAKKYRLSDSGKEANKKYENKETTKQIRKKATAKYAKGVGKVKILTRTIARRLGKIQRTPAWLTDNDHWMIGQAYELAALRSKMTGFVWHVDHVIPLQGKTVSGLHTPYNLQVIPAAVNISKSNKFLGA